MLLLFLSLDPLLSAAVSPSSYVGADIVPYNSFTLVCNASKPSEVIPELELLWYNNQTQLLDSNIGVSISEEGSGGTQKSSALSVSSASSSSSGTYLCIAKITVDESSTIEAMATAVIVIKGKPRIHCLDIDL